MAAEIWVVLRNDYEMAVTGFDETVAPRAQIALARCVGLDGYRNLVIERVQLETAHTTSAAVTTNITTTSTTSVVEGWRRFRNGLNPMFRMVRPGCTGIVPAMFDVRDDGALRTLTITNPGRRNAIPSEQWGRLAELFAEFESSEQRVLLLTGADGDFCSGADMGSDFVPGAVIDGYEMLKNVGAAALALHRCTKPTVAAVDGVAAGAGMNLALGCDVLIASDRARFAEIFVRRGLTLDFGGTWLLPRLIGLARAKELALTGRVFDVAEAERLGLVSRVVPSDDLASVATAVGRELAAGAPLAQRFIKAGLDRSFEMSFEQALSYEQTVQSVLLASEDFFEGAASFLQKRDPEFKGK